MEVDGLTFRRAVRAADLFRAVDPWRPVLTGFGLYVQDDRLVIEAADNYICCRVRVPIKDPNGTWTAPAPFRVDGLLAVAGLIRKGDKVQISGGDELTVAVRRGPTTIMATDPANGDKWPDTSIAFGRAVVKKLGTALLNPGLLSRVIKAADIIGGTYFAESRYLAPFHVWSENPDGLTLDAVLMPIKRTPDERPGSRP